MRNKLSDFTSLKCLIKIDLGISKSEFSETAQRRFITKEEMISEQILNNIA